MRHLDRKPYRFACCVSALLLISGSHAHGQAAIGDIPAVRLSLSGDLPTTATLTAEDLEVYPHRTVNVIGKDGVKAAYEGVSLSEILKKAGSPSGAQLKGNAMASYVLAVGRDGYQVTFTLTELDPGIGDSNVIVADKRDGKPLSAQEGPIRVIAASDKKPARSVRMLEALRVVLLRKDQSVQR